MKKKNLYAATGVSHASMTKHGKTENLNKEILVKICLAQDCNISDSVENIRDEEKHSEQE